MGFATALTYNAIYRVCNLLVLFLITVLLSRSMGTAGFGMLSLMIANGSVFNLITSFGSDSGITYTMASGTLKKNDFVAIVLLILLVQLAILGLTEAVSFTISGHLWLLKTANQKLWWLGLCFLVSISLQEKMVAALNGKLLFSFCNRAMLFCNLITLSVFAVFFFTNSTQDLSFYLVLYVLLSLFQALTLTFVAYSFSSFSFRIAMVRKREFSLFFSYSLFVFLINCIQFLAYRVDFWILDFYKDENQLGIYSLAVRLVQLYWILPLLFASIIFPNVVAATTDRRQDMHLLLRVMNALTFLSSVILFIAVRPLIVVIFGPEYSLSALAFQVLLPGVAVFGNSIILAAYFAGANKLRINFLGSLLCFASIFLLDVLLIPERGFVGAAMASSAGYFITTLYFMVTYSRKNKQSLSLFFFPQKADWVQLQLLTKKIFKSR